jgi:hypothetical protein
LGVWEIEESVLMTFASWISTCKSGHSPQRLEHLQSLEAIMELSCMEIVSSSLEDCQAYQLNV